MAHKPRFIDALMAEPIKMAGLPFLVVTRAFAYDYYVSRGLPAVGGFASADYLALRPSPSDEPLTDPVYRDAVLAQVAAIEERA